MDSEAGGQLGGMSADEGVRRRLAGQSREWKCGACGEGSNEDVLKGQAELCSETEAEKERTEKEDELAREISFAPKAEQGVEGAMVAEKEALLVEAEGGEGASRNQTSGSSQVLPPPSPQQQQQQSPTVSAPTRTVPPVHPVPQHPQPQPQQLQPQHMSRDVWLDRAIVGISLALVVMVLRQLLV